jgi:glycosyltransferase involved in cell wall biosynthesis
VGGAMVFHDGQRWLSQARFLNYLNELSELLGPVDFFSALCVEDPSGAFSTPVPDTISVHPIRFSSFSRTRRLLETARLTPAMVQACRRRGAVIHFFPAALTPVNQILLRWCADAYITYYKSDWIAWTKGEAGRQGWKVRYWSSMEALELRLADASLFRSDAHRRRLSARGKGVHELAQPILSATPDRETCETESFADPSSRCIQLLFVGVLERYKGLLELIGALSVISTQHSDLDWQLHLVGAPQMRSEQDPLEPDATWLPQWLKEAIDSARLESRIVIHGYIDDPASLSALYQKADLFVLPSWTEGFPRVIDEAMSFALPIITTPVGGIPDVLQAEEDVVFVQPRDLESLTAGLLRLMTDEQQRQAFSIASRTSFERRVLRSAARQHADLIHSVRQRSS